jgi:hypothetical protein
MAHDGVELQNATWISTCHFSRIMRMTSFVDYGRLDRGFIEKSILIREFTEEINCPPTSGSLSSQFPSFLGKLTDKFPFGNLSVNSRIKIDFSR